MCYELYQPAIDLFGEVVVLESELFEWVSAVAPRWSNTEKRIRHYIESYDVASKVRFAKLSGRYDEIVSVKAPVWHPRLALDVINK